MLAAALCLSLVSFALRDLWGIVLAVTQVSGGTAAALHAIWIPLSMEIVEGAIAVLGAFGFTAVWSGRRELGDTFASRVGLAVLAFLAATFAYALYTFTGILLGTFAGLGSLQPWHGLLGVAGSVALGFGLYWILANLPVPGSRPVALIALALGVAGIAILSLADLGLGRTRVAAPDGAGLGLALVSITLWLVLCLWGRESLRGIRRTRGRPMVADG